MTVRKTVPGTQLLLYSAAVLVVAPLCCYGCCTYSGWCGCGSSGLFNFHLNFFFLCFFHRCCSTTGEFLNGQYVSVLVANIVIHQIFKKEGGLFTFLSKATAGIFEFDIFSASGNYNCFGIFLIIITVRSSTLVMIFSFLQIFVAFLF